MKVRSIIVLCLWMASLVAPFLPLQAEACEGNCCVGQTAVCAAEAMGGDCPGMREATRLHPIPVAPLNTVHGTAIQSSLTASQTQPLELSLAHPTIDARSLPLRLPSQPIPLLI